MQASDSAAVADSLENSGKLEQLRAKVRAGIYDALERPQASEEGVCGHYLIWCQPYNPALTVSGDCCTFE